MSSVFRLLARFFGARSTVSRPTRERMRRWCGEVQRLCAQGSLAAAQKALDRCPLIEAPQQALQAIEQAVVPILRLCERQRDAETALATERWAYNLVKLYERASHYDACLRAMDAPLHALGMQAAAGRAQASRASRQRVLFYVHSLGAEMAHMQLLAELIEAHVQSEPQSASDIGIIGREGPQGRCASIRRMASLGVSIREVGLREPLAAMFEAADDEMNRQRFGQLIFVSIPVGLSYACARLGPDRVGWLSMKFEIGAIEALRWRYSFSCGLRQEREAGGKAWLAAAPLMNRPPPLETSTGGPPRAVASARRLGTVLYTVNREEKIRDPAYLDAVCDVLQRCSGTAFVWTGHNALPAITNVFERRGLADRQFFAGWVSPDDLLGACDIFLDTPHLSGTVAARAMLLGKPVVTWAGSQAWINFFAEAIERDATRSTYPEIAQGLRSLRGRGITLACADVKAFGAQAARLVNDPALRSEYGALLQRIAERYFLDSARAARDHFANFKGLPLPP